MTKWLTVEFQERSSKLSGSDLRIKLTGVTVELLALNADFARAGKVILIMSGIH